MIKEKISNNANSGHENIEKPNDMYSTQSEASDTEGLRQINNPNISRVHELTESIDANDDDDDDDMADV